MEVLHAVMMYLVLVDYVGIHSLTFNIEKEKSARTCPRGFLRVGERKDFQRGIALRKPYQAQVREEAKAIIIHLTKNSNSYNIFESN